MENIQSQKSFLYARKSTDVEDKQVLSIDAQLTELRAFARENNFHIAEEFVEKQSAKVPGRPMFGQMVARIEQGEADSIISWHPDRLARNSVDGGRLIYLLDTGVLASLKFPTFWCDNTSQGKFMLSMAFGQSKYYVDSLSENTKRGLRQKVRLGIFPGRAPEGYMNDVRTKTIVVHKKNAKVIRSAFLLYSKGDQRLEDISHFLAQSSITTGSGKRICKTKVSSILSNPFYIGLFRYGGELHEGSHEPIISKKLFDQVQVVLKQRGKPERKAKNEPLPLCGLISCTTCGMMITGEHKFKRQKNGNVHEYWYYRCSKKNKQVKCVESCISAASLEHQLSSLIKAVSLPADWAVELNRMAKEEHAKSAQSAGASVKEKQEHIQTISIKLERLLNGYLEQIIDEQDYRTKKAKLLSEKKSLEGEIASLSRNANDWLEPMQEWIKDAQHLAEIASDCDLFRKKVAAKEIFGSNLRLGGKVLAVVAGDAQENGSVPVPSPWAALRAAHDEIGQRPLSCVLVPDRDSNPSFWCQKPTSYFPVSERGKSGF